MTKDMSEEKDDICWCEDPACPARRDAKKIADLESRLKEANQDFIQYHHNSIVAQKNKEIQSLEQRLSQAEADRERFKIALIEIRDTMKKDGRFPATVPEIEKVLNGEESEKIESLEARLSHLMDVGGKMAGALKTIATNEPLGVTHLNSSTVKRIAEEAIAEWDGIKDGKHG